MRSVVLLVLLCVAGVACGGAGDPAPAELVGVIVEIESEKGSILSFTLEANGEDHTIYIAKDIDYGFDLHHLFEHRATGEPVRCVLEARGERLYAVEIVDAPVT